MTSKRELKSAVHALNAEIEALNAAVEIEAKRADRAWGRVNEFHEFLANILELHPALDHFRRDDETWGQPTRVWDIEGVKAAKDFQRTQAIAAKYTEQEIAGRRLYEAEKKSAGSAKAGPKSSNFDGLGRVL